MERRIKVTEYFSSGKKRGENQDGFFFGENFVAIIDGVSHKNTKTINEKRISIADIITNAIKEMDRSDSKYLDFNHFVSFVNSYISSFFTSKGLAGEMGSLEATAVIYSKHHNQIWLIGDCGAIFKENGSKKKVIVENPLRIDTAVYIPIRNKIISALHKEGYSVKDTLGKDISKEIIKKPELLKKYIKSYRTLKDVYDFWAKTIVDALRACQFTENDCRDVNTIRKYLNPRVLQEYLKNNPNVGNFGYAVLNGIRTEESNCVIKQLPNNVSEIILFSDGFSSDSLKQGSVRNAILREWRMAYFDRLGRQKTHCATPYFINYQNGKIGKRQFDDMTAVIFQLHSQHEQDIDISNGR